MTNEAPSNGWVVFDQVAIDLAGKRLFATKATKGDGGANERGRW